MNHPHSNINKLEDIGELMGLNSPNVLNALSQIQSANKYPYILFPNALNKNIIEVIDDTFKTKLLEADVHKKVSNSQKKFLEHFCYLPKNIKIPERGKVIKKLLEEREGFNWITVTIFIFLLSICIYVYNVIDPFMGGSLIFVLIFLIGWLFSDMGWFEKKYIREKILSDKEIKEQENLLEENYNKERKNFSNHIHSYYNELNNKINIKDDLLKIKNKIKEREEEIKKEEQSRTKFSLGKHRNNYINESQKWEKDMPESDVLLFRYRRDQDPELRSLKEEERKLSFNEQHIIFSNIFERKGYNFSDVQIKTYKERHSLFKEYFIPIINNSLNLKELNYLTNQIQFVYAPPKKGYWEDVLSKELKARFPESVYLDRIVGNYFPDIILKIKNIWIDIEIDEPYDYKTRKEIHYLEGEDNKRNSFFTENNWFVLRFSEMNVRKNLTFCLDIINSMVEFILIGDVHLLIKTQKLMEQICHKHWTKEEAKIMALNRTREK